MKVKTISWRIIIVAWIVGISILLGALFYSEIYTPRIQSDVRNTYTVTITDKEIAPRITKPQYFYIIYGYDEDEHIYRTFALDDWTGRANTSDWYGAIEVGETYTIETMGERVPLISGYPNIINIEGLEIREDGRVFWQK